MHKHIINFFVLSVSFCFLLTGTSAASTFGDTLHSHAINIGDGVSLTRSIHWDSHLKSLQTENYVTYTPSASVSPLVSYGNTVLSKQTVGSLAKSLESAGKRVLGGTNGDYYVVASGSPLGIVVTDGILRSSASYHSALGFYQDGSAVIGTPDLSIMADFMGYSLKIANVNKTRSSDGYYLFTEDFGPSTKNTLTGIDVILTPSSDNLGSVVTGADGSTSLTCSNQLGIGKIVTCTVDSVQDSKGDIPIPKGKFVLSISEKGGQWLQDMLHTLTPGDTVKLEIYSQDSRWNNVQHALGGFVRLLDNGTVFTGTADTSSAPRTAVGVKPDGSTVFYTLDGRQKGYSTGTSVRQVALRLAEMGCTDAVLLDGGGSTTMISTYPDSSSSTIINKPSDGAQRAVSNALFLVSNLKATSVPGSLFIKPAANLVMPGASISTSVTTLDTGWYPMNPIAEPIHWSASAGTVSPQGVFTAPSTSGVYTITAESGSIRGQTDITVAATPTGITVTDESTGKPVSTLNLTPGESVSLTAAASLQSLPLYGSDKCFHWTCDTAIGSISSDGTFTSGQKTASGVIMVASGNYAVTIKVNVIAPDHVSLIEDFEDTLPIAPGVDIRKESAAGFVRYGNTSLRVPATVDGSTVLIPAEITPQDSYLSIWAKSELPGTISARFCKEDGSPTYAELSLLGGYKWTQLSCSIPEDAVSLESLTVQSSSSCIAWLDQIIFAGQPVYDNTPPQISVSVNKTNIQASVKENTADLLSKERISLRIDGVPVSFNWNASSSTLSAAVASLSSGTHQITVTAVDASGNIGRGSKVSTGDDKNLFKDMSSHWAKSYTSRLSQSGIINGITTASGTYFYPNQSITRGDFALMTSRWLNLDLNSYKNVSLPFTDTNAIPQWDFSAIQALYQLGIMQGSKSPDGSIQVRASSTITRAEAMTILGRLQPRGYGQVSLKSFKDYSSIPSYAFDHISSLVSQGIVSGSDGKLNPNLPVSRAEVAKLLFCLW